MRARHYDNVGVKLCMDPVEGSLYLLEPAVLGEVAGVDENVTAWELWLAVTCVSDTQTIDAGFGYMTRAHSPSSPPKDGGPLARARPGRSGAMAFGNLSLYGEREHA